MSSYKYFKTISAIFAVAFAVIIVINMSNIFSFGDSATTTTEALTVAPSVSPLPETSAATSAPQTTAAATLASTVPSSVTPDSSTAAAVVTPPVTDAATTAATADPSTWSKEQVVSAAVDAMTKTRAYTGSVTVTRSDETAVNITECTGGSVVKNIANRAVGSFTEPSNETLSFSGGVATSAEDGTVPLLLPLKTEYALPVDGVSSATAVSDGTNTTITITLVPETSTLTTAPTYNATTIGYLDLSTVSISGVTIQDATMSYPGSTIVYVINSDGLITSADYTIPIEITINGKISLVNGVVKLTANQKEKWAVQW